MDFDKNVQVESYDEKYLSRRSYSRSSLWRWTAQADRSQVERQVCTTRQRKQKSRLLLRKLLNVVLLVTCTLARAIL